MKVTQVPNNVVRDNSIKELNNPNLYRVTLCDDGHHGHNHIMARLKPVKNLTMEELTATVDDKRYGFIEIVEDNENA